MAGFGLLGNQHRWRLLVTRGQATAGGLTGGASEPTLAALCSWPCCTLSSACWSTSYWSVVDRVPIAISSSSSSARSCSSFDAPLDDLAGGEPIA